ncbi:MAG: DRTGG domain-containing protein [Spirochaetes bacterium]|jgi:hypothetical protein|nr:DRTGG domain-containing protein [Spirochaetota bacterium]
MKIIIMASTREMAGKTSLLVGLMKKGGKSFGYIKPLGDRLLYRHKRNWDYDSCLVTDIFGLDEDPENITLGFDHSKMRFVYSEANIRESLDAMAKTVGKGKDVLFVEGGKDLFHGASLGLDSLSLAAHLGGQVVLVAGGTADQILDDVMFVRKYISIDSPGFGGIILNKVADTDDFESVHLKELEKSGARVLGIVPFKEQLTHFTMSYLADKLYAKVLAGEKGMANVVKHVFVGAMSTDESLRNPVFNKEKKFLITSGDRSDMIHAALDSDTSGILLTNNILPPGQILARASEKNIPLLLVTMDTYQATRQVDSMEALLTADNGARIEMLGQLSEKYLKMKEILE